MKKLFIVSVFATILLNCYGTKIKYPAFTISDSLKRNAWAVIRSHQTTVEVISLTKTRTEITKVITVLNKNGKKLAWGNFNYDNDRKIVQVDVNLYNAMGIREDHWARGDLNDVSYDPYGTTYTDTRLLTAKPVNNNYPYTVEYKLVYEQNNTYSIRRWFPVWSYNISVEKSSYEIKFPNNIPLNFDEKNLNSLVTKSTNQNQIKWTLENFSALKYEPYSPDSEEYLPIVSVVASKFSYDGYEGGFNSWKDLGSFRAKLNIGRNDLTSEKKEEIKKLIDTCSTTYDKVKCLYEYMQSHTRYILISEGIGGLQPVPATTVSKTGYGDCKALSNYMLAILKSVGIKSYYALIKAGAFEYYFDSNFVSHQSNHIILCVPLKNDTIWLECTSQTAPYGFLGDFTDNRYALLITENGGLLAKTPKYSKKQNHITRIGHVNIGENGDCSANIESEYTGLEYDEMHHLSIEDKEEQLKMLYENYDIPNFKIKSFELNAQNNRYPLLNEKLELELISYASQSGSRIFLPMNLASKSTYVPTELIERKLAIHKKYTGSYSDTLTYYLPENYSVELIPAISSIDNKYGKYNAEIIKNDNSLVYIRNYEINKGIYPSKEYEAFRSFFKEIRESDKCMVVLKRN